MQVLAAANPVSGHYNRAKTVCENLRLPPNILSRFDLVFVLLDRPNEEMDRMLSLHVMALHGGRSARGCARPTDGAGGLRRAADGTDGPLRRDRGGAFADADGYGEWCAGADGSLALRLRRAASELGESQLMPPSLLRKYIAYARTHVHPVLGVAARRVLEDFYLQLRLKQRGGCGQTGVTCRPASNQRVITRPLLLTGPPGLGPQHRAPPCVTVVT